MTTNGYTLWLTGLPGAGKTTLAAGVRDELVARGRAVEVLDGDEMRATLCRDLGFSKADRDENVRRIGLVARLLAGHGVVAIVAAVSPYRESRDEVRRSHGGAFVEVFVDCGVAELIRRDPKGLYARAMRGEIAEFSGVSAPYEAPAVPDIHVRTDSQTVAETVRAIVRALETRKLIE